MRLVTPFEPLRLDSTWTSWAGPPDLGSRAAARAGPHDTSTSVSAMCPGWCSPTRRAILLRHGGVSGGNVDTAVVSEVVQQAGGAVPVHPSASGALDRPASAVVHGAVVHGAVVRPTACGSGASTTLPSLPRTFRTRWPCFSLRSSMLATARLEDPPVRAVRASRPARSHGRWSDSRAAVSLASNWQMRQSKGRISSDTFGRRTFGG